MQCWDQYGKGEEGRQYIKKNPSISFELWEESLLVELLVPQPEIICDDPLEPEEAGEYEGGQEDEDDHHHGCERADCGQLRNMMDADLRRRRSFYF